MTCRSRRQSSSLRNPYRTFPMQTMRGSAAPHIQTVKSACKIAPQGRPACNGDHSGILSRALPEPLNALHTACLPALRVRQCRAGFQATSYRKIRAEPIPGGNAAVHICTTVRKIAPGGSGSIDTSSRLIEGD